MAAGFILDLSANFTTLHIKKEERKEEKKKPFQTLMV